MQPDTKYAKSGDLHIAYQVIGDGPLDLVVSPGFVSHLDLNWTQPTFPRYVRRLASFARVMLFDKRGTGLSDPVAGLPSIDERMDDIRAVMDAAGSERAALLGFSEGGPMSIMFAATYPERTVALVLYGTYASAAGVDESDIAKFYDLVDHWGEGRTLSLLAPSVSDNALYRKAIGVYERAAASPAMVRALIDSARTIDVRPVLPTIRVPTLVIHRRGDSMPVELGREVADSIPGARFVELSGIDHIPWIGDTDAVVDLVEEFLTGTRHQPQADRVLATVLFTDIVRGTEHAASIGDQRWREIMDRHNETVRRLLAEYRGLEVKTTGDGFLATFDGPARAIHCALAVLELVQALGVRVRAGLHTGECERMDENDVGGLTVNIASRVAALAGPGEVLISRTLRDLVIGSGLAFADRGTHVLKGVPEEWQLYAVTERPSAVLPPVPLADAMPRGDRALLRIGQRAPRMVRAIARATGRPGSRERRS